MKLLVIGAGGHAKVVVDAAIAAGYEIAGVVGREGDSGAILGTQVSYDRSAIVADGFIAAIGDNRARAEYFSACVAEELQPVSVVHPSAIIGREAVVEDGAFVAAGVVVNSGARIGANAILNTGCTVDHDCRIGAHAHIGPSASLCGSVSVGEGALMGVGSCAIPGANIGDWAVVGAGAAVVRDVPADSVWAGVPARDIADRSGADV